MISLGRSDRRVIWCWYASGQDHRSPPEKIHTILIAGSRDAQKTTQDRTPVRLADCERRNGADNLQAAKVVASILAGSLPRKDRTQQVGSKKQQAGEDPPVRQP